MPIYEYQCNKCSAITETLRSAADRDLPLACKTCGSPAARILSLFNKGSIGTSESPAATRTKIRGADHALASITNCTFENCKVGVSLPEGTNVTMKGNKFKNVETPVEFRKPEGKKDA